MQLRQQGAKNEYYKSGKDPIQHQGLPSPAFILGISATSVMKLDVSNIEFMNFNNSHETK
jgi:hypothetical protein